LYAAHIAVTLAAAVANLAAGVADLRRAGWIMENMSRYGVPPSWASPLGAAKVAGGAGLLVGLVVPAVGVAAAAGLVAYFVGAVVTVLRARWYSHLVFPAAFLLLAAAALGSRLAVP
jgi:hypothetical protein